MESGRKGNEYVEVRNGGFYVAGTRIGLDVIAADFEAGRSPEAILGAYPSTGFLAKVYGAITFLLDHPQDVQTYLAEQDRIFETMQGEYPRSSEVVARLERAREKRASQRS